jgi:hypothetical protein
MNNISVRIAELFFLLPVLASGQENLVSADSNEEAKKKILYGFVRGGFYGGTDDSDDKFYLPSVYSDFALKLETGNGTRFKGFADLRFRYGTEFKEPVNRLDLREAYVTVNGKKWDISAGQKIIKWGRADFTNPTQKLSPQNLISRSPDHEDMDMGNLLMSARWYPSPVISLEAVAIPCYRSSVLLIEPLELPSYVTINQIESLVTDKKLFTYGVKADLHVKGVDFSFSWFDGYDPMPGTKLSDFSIDTIGSIPFPSVELTMTPYKIRNIGFDFETTIGDFGFRGEAAWTLPSLSNKSHEYVPCQEIKWVAGVDWMKGNWRITAEYSGKAIPDFEPVTVEPFIGTELDPATLAILLATPGFDLEDYVRQQVGAFNRLYNYQLEKSYHSSGLRVETDLFYGKLTPSITALYNFTSRDFMVMPELTWKPVDGLTISVGGEFFSGLKGSVYDIVDEFMNCFKVGLKVNF